jgi:hypothetical protein
MFRMDESGARVPDWNLCVHSASALAVACERAVAYAKLLRPSTGRHFFWIDDARPMCHCPECRSFSDSDQALILENALLEALCEEDPGATIAHLAYLNTLDAPTQIRPRPGVFLEFAPILRRHDVSIGQRSARFDRPGAPSHGEHLDALDANLAVFGLEGAQILEYWLDVSRFAHWQRTNTTELPWDGEVFDRDLSTYAERGVRNVTSFAVWVDGTYVHRFGEPPLVDYGTALCEFIPR